MGGCLTTGLVGLRSSGLGDRLGLTGGGEGVQPRSLRTESLSSGGLWTVGAGGGELLGLLLDTDRSSGWSLDSGEFGWCCCSWSGSTISDLSSENGF